MALIEAMTPKELEVLLGEVIIPNRNAPTRRTASRGDRWQIRKLGQLWMAWPIEAGVYARKHPFGGEWVQYLGYQGHAAAIADVTHKIYSR